MIVISSSVNVCRLRIALFDKYKDKLVYKKCVYIAFGCVHHFVTFLLHYDVTGSMHASDKGLEQDHLIKMASTPFTTLWHPT